MSREEHLRQMKSVEEELQNTTSEYRKRDLRKITKAQKAIESI